jgi:predicted esterase
MTNPHLDLPAHAANLGRVGQYGFGIVAIHGRGQSPAFMLDLLGYLSWADFPIVAPAAHEQTWYPQKFMMPLADNQPWLDHAHEAVATSIERFTALGLAPSQVVLVGFSQGACLLADFIYRNPTHYKAVCCFTGGLPGEAGSVWPPTGSLSQTPIFLSSSEVDEWVPPARVRETAAVFEQMQGQVSCHIYANRPHEVCEEELAAVRHWLS